MKNKLNEDDDGSPTKQRATKLSLLTPVSLVVVAGAGVLCLVTAGCTAFSNPATVMASMPAVDAFCPKCNGRMAAGYVIDNSGETAYPSVSRWADRAPERKNIFCNEEVPGAKPITTYRCKRCGYLESYAP